jgi:hypothetical protein
MSRTDQSTVAEWMLEQFEREGHLDQQRAAAGIADKFGARFTYVTASGNLAIDQKVLHGFRGLTEDVVVWSRSERFWRRRVAGDGAGRVCP